MTPSRVAVAAVARALAAGWLVTLAVAQERPQVLELSPPHLATGVATATQGKLTVTFDRDMDQATFGVCGGGPSFPKVVRKHWPDARTFVLEVELEADCVYALDLACAGSAGFRSTDGQSLRPHAWRFATRGQALPEGAAALTAERLFRAIERNYSYRDRLGIDWSDIAQTHHDALLSAPDGAALALRAAEVLANAQDPHISVRWNDATIGTWQRTAVANVDLRSVQKTFPKLDRIGKVGLRATTEDGIGYVHVATFAREQRDDFDLLIEAVRQLRSQKALVLDLRANAGGDETLARRLAAFFVRGEKVYAAHRVRDPEAPDGFRPREDRTVRGNQEPDVFEGSVAVLTGPMCMSSCEAFLLMMKQAEKAILIGADSYGSSGNPVPHTLHPGLQVMLPSWQALRPDGTMFEGEGIAPHIHVPTRPEQLADSDPILQEALQRLR
jgi:Peptidase family S41